MNISEYVSREHGLSRIDPRVKLLVTLAILVMVLSYRGFAFHLIVGVTSLLLCKSMKIPWKIILLRFTEPLVIVFIIVLLKIFFTGEKVLFTFSLMGFEIAGYRDGLMEGLVIGSRIIAAISAVAVMVFSTPFTELAAALSWCRVPRGFVEILVYAYRYVFVLIEDAGVIYDAQKNRLGYSTLGRGFNSFGILAGSLILKAFEHSHNVTVAMVQRGYDGNIPMLKHKPFRPAEIFFSIILVTALGIVWKM